MAESILSAQHIIFSYDSQDKTLFSGLSASFPGGWTAVAGPNGAGKSTLLRLLDGSLFPHEGTVVRPGAVLYVEQVCGTAPDGLFDLFSRSDREALALIALLELEYDWPYRWDTLSQGEKKRCQIGAAIAANPEALLLDEPVNHLDSRSRKLTAEAMGAYGGCGVLVSHSRNLMDRYCSRTLFLPEGIMYPGGYSKASAERERLEEEERRRYDKARHELVRLQKEASRRRALAETQQKRRSKKNLDRKDSDGRAKLDLVRISGKDGTGGRLLRQMDGRISQAARRLDRCRRRSEDPLGISFSTGTVSRSDFLWRRVGGMIPYCENSEQGVIHGDLELRPGEVVLITGDNGAGKSTLLKSIFGDLGDSAWFLEQELTPQGMECMNRTFIDLDRRERGRVLSTVTRMGARPEDFLTHHKWSPGESKKLMFSLALEREIGRKTVILLDEPVNHLDLDSRHVLEEAFGAYRGAIVMVSHDNDFLKERISRRWELVKTDRGSEFSNNYQ